MPPFSGRDFLYLATLIAGLFGTWLTMDRRVTSMEATRRAEKLAERVVELEKAREATAVVAARLEDVTKKVDQLQDDLKTGFAELIRSLAEIQARVQHDRRAGAYNNPGGC